jgi:hypothetical protein
LKKLIENYNTLNDEECDIMNTIIEPSNIINQLKGCLLLIIIMDKTKELLINNYAQNYEPKFYREWINLSLTKLSGFKTWTQGNLNSTQIETFNNLLLNKDLNKEHFLNALNLLTHKQISYVGW